MSTKAYTTERSPRELTIVRTIAAPRELVFRAWTEPEHLAAWWGPKGFTNPVCEVDARVGGRFRIVMRSPGGDEYPLEGRYLELVAPERLSFEAARGQLDELAETILTIVTFEDQGGATKLAVTSRFESEPDLERWLEMRAVEGWAQSLERLDALVADR
jgi:uncharacterized protein YndB with AHSA1/START domain